MKHVFPEGIQRRELNEEPAPTHPQSVRKRRDGERDDKDREDATNEDDERLCGDEVEEEPEDPGEECLGARTEVAEPVFNDREEDGDKEKIGERDR